MKCPKCQHEMEKVATHEAVADRCSDCKGLWFDMLEHEDMRASAKAIDIGDASVGAKMNAVDRIDCPVCKVPMLRMVDPQQPHIWFESCPTCYGRFYDAGEYRDFAELTIADLFKRFKAAERS